MGENDLLTFYLPIAVTVLIAALFALATKDGWTAFWRGLFTSIFLLATYHFIKGLVIAGGVDNPREGDLVWGGLSGLLLGVVLGGLVGLGVGYGARALVGQKPRY